MIERRVPRLQAYIWHCQDDVCDCHRPVVELVMPRHDSVAVKTVTLWSSPPISEPSAEELQQMRGELAAAAAKYSIPLDAEWTGERFPLPMMAAVEYERQAEGPGGLR